MTRPSSPKLYVALGDSMSIDLYPALDDVERNGHAAPRPGMGAASLLYRNHDELFPEFAGRDLASSFPGIEHVNLCADGATTADVLEGQIPAMPRGAALVTVTAGGNDVLGMIGARKNRGGLTVRDIATALAEIVRLLRKRADTIVLATVYDPSDGTGRLDQLQVTEREIGWLTEYNKAVRALCDGDSVRLADAHAHFRGHGITAPAAQRWFWSQSIIEPGALGASEIRRLWLGAM